MITSNVSLRITAHIITVLPSFEQPTADKVVWRLVWALSWGRSVLIWSGMMKNDSRDHLCLVEGFLYHLHWNTSSFWFKGLFLKERAKYKLGSEAQVFRLRCWDIVKARLMRLIYSVWGEGEAQREEMMKTEQNPSHTETSPTSCLENVNAASTAASTTV